MSDPDFWNDQERARTVIDEANRIKGWVEPWTRLSDRADELETVIELLEMEEDPDLSAELQTGLRHVSSGVEELELRTMLQGEDDHREAIVTIHPGAGGYSVNVMDLQPAEEGGIKNATLEIKGESAYGYLKAEGGVHRLVRISPFDAQARRHTSFASVFVYPLVEDDIEIEVNESDLRVDTYRASGAGGQHVNKTDSAVRLTHLPTGIVVACQQERSQHKNRSTAMKMLRAALYQRELAEREAAKNQIEAGKSAIDFGSQIRSYVLHPYRMVKDHRTNVEVGDADSVLDGGLDPFIEASLREGLEPGA